MLIFAICLVIFVLTFTVVSNLILLSERSQIGYRVQRSLDGIENISSNLSSLELRTEEKIWAILNFLEAQLIREYDKTTGYLHYTVNPIPEISCFPGLVPNSPLTKLVTNRPLTKKGGGKK